MKGYRDTNHWHSMGDAAAEGLLQGIAAGLVMVAYLVGAGLLLGMTPVETVQRIGFWEPGSWLVGVATHLSMAAVYGVVWGVLWRFVRPRLPLPAWLAGVLYGALLFVLAQMLFLAAISAPQPFPLEWLFVAHLVYGLALGLLAHFTSPR